MRGATTPIPIHLHGVVLSLKTQEQINLHITFYVLTLRPIFKTG